jgi:hypothetical protein
VLAIGQAASKHTKRKEVEVSYGTEITTAAVWSRSVEERSHGPGGVPPLVSVCPLVAYPLGVRAQESTPVTRIAAQGFEGKWRDEMREALSLRKGPQEVPIEVVISGSKATFARNVWQPGQLGRGRHGVRCPRS